MVFSLTSPVLVVWDLVPVAVRAAWTAIAAIAIGINSLYQNHQNFVRSAVTLQVLRAERFLFDTRTGPYRAKDDEDALDHFTRKLKGEWLAETFAWANQTAPTDEP